MRAQHGQGDLDQRMTVSTKGGKERYRYAGNMIYEIAAKILAKWIVNGKIAEGATASQLIAVGVDKGRHWILNRNREELNQAAIAKIMQGQAVQPEKMQTIICARDIMLYNPERKELALNPVAILHLRLVSAEHPTSGDGAALELYYLDATIPEVAGMLHLVSQLRLKRLYDNESRALMERVPLKKSV